jgi:glycosyltransferase involved in cell wall biosynthesis
VSTRFSSLPLSLANDPGVNVLGHISGDFGIGEGTRSSLKSLEAVGVPFSIRDCKADWHYNTNSTYTVFSEDNPHPINLIHMNPDIFRYIGFPSIGYEYLEGRYNIGFWAWEVPVFPQDRHELFQFFDEIWAPSNYSVEAISSVSPIPVLRIPHSISLPSPLALSNRRSMNLPDDKFIFLFSFDYFGISERKNPLGVAEAFRKAFGFSNEHCILVIKCLNSKTFPNEHQKLQQKVLENSSIKIIDSHFSRSEINALISSCDAYISLHRAEGFGLTMAEAMYYGKPVIATGYSANLDFMNVSNGFLVRYNLIETDQDYTPYPKGSLWADPDLDHAAFLMRYVVKNYSQAQQVGKKAAHDTRLNLSPHSVGERIKSRLERVLYFHFQNQQSFLQKLAWQKTAQQFHEELKDTRIKLGKIY